MPRKPTLVESVRARNTAAPHRIQMRLKWSIQFRRQAWHGNCTSPGMPIINLHEKLSEDADGSRRVRSFEGARGTRYGRPPSRVGSCAFARCRSPGASHAVTKETGSSKMGSQARSGHADTNRSRRNCQVPSHENLRCAGKRLGEHALSAIPIVSVHSHP
jgi:hypothetical protein